MKIKTEDVSSSNQFVGQTVWICDYRQPDLDKKPIRHVPPCAVLVRSNKDANKVFYYSENHFVKLKQDGTPSSTTYPLFDNTGYRSNTGTALQVFTTERECIEAYNKMADDIIARVDDVLKNVVNTWQTYRQKVVESKLN